MTIDDMELVRQYAQHQSEAAFADLVSRHTDMVYSAALRQVRNPELAEEVTQAVFVILARKAASLDAKILLSGWLYRTACFVAGSALKQEIRRQSREQEAYMDSTLQETRSAWEQMSPLLDEAMLRLGQADRDALMLRFFEGRSLQEVGAVLGASEDAAKKRVNRAVEKLRQFFSKRGVVLSAAVLTAMLSAYSVQAAPATLAKVATTVAFTKGAASSNSSLTPIKGALKIMAWTKVKTAIVVSVGILLAAGTATVTVQQIREHRGEAWQFEPPSPTILDKLPRGAKILPSRALIGGMSWDGDGRVLGVSGSPVKDIIMHAYMPYGSMFPNRIVLNTTLPPGKFDFYANLPKGSPEALQKEIKRKFGLVARFETIETNVFLLQVKYPNSPGLKRSVAESGSTSTEVGRITATKGTMKELVSSLEIGKCSLPIFDRTGLTNEFDYELHCDFSNQEDLQKAFTDQLGLELVPAVEPVKMLVVEKAR